MAKMTVEGTSLTAVADAIRAKGDTTEPLVFPDGFVSAIGGIRGGLFLTPLVDRSITEVTADVLAGCTKVGYNAFNACTSLTSIVIPESVTSIEDYAFYVCRGLTSIVIPESVTFIGDSVFYGCSKLASINLPSAITSIGNNEFYGCSSLTNIVIPENVRDIWGRAFYECSGLTTVEMKRVTPPTVNSNSFYKCTALTKIIVPAGTLSAYQSATNWSAYADIMVEASE